ncbi:MAG TPA: CrcB family protein [Mycobacteriales bacterium]|nr:CrcB family protein [Mycobacteriales bacterium]
MTALLLVLAGGALGAPLRLLVVTLVPGPRGTLAVNAAGSLLAGVLAGAGAAAGWPPEALLLAVTGFCGALTTLSAVGVEAALLGRRSAAAAARVLLLQAAVPVAAAALGWAAGAGLAG